MNRETRRFMKKRNLSDTGTAGIVLANYLGSCSFSGRMPDSHHNSRDAKGKRKYDSMRRKMMQR